MSRDRPPSAPAVPDSVQGSGEVAPAVVPLEEVRGLLRERDHLLLLHEALADVARAATLEERLRVFVDAICRIGFGRVTITLRDAELNPTAIVSAGLTPAEERSLWKQPVSGVAWRRRLMAIERFRVSNSYYLDGRDPWVEKEFGGGLPSALPAGDDPDWSPRDTLLVPLRAHSGAVVATLILDDPDDRARPTLTRVRTVELFGQQVAAMIEQASLTELAERRARRFQKLHAVGSQLSRSLDEETILRMVARQLEELVHARRVVTFSLDAGGSIAPRAMRREGRELDPAEADDVVIALAERSARTGRAEMRQGALSVAALSGDATLGALVVESSSGDPFDSDDAELVAAIGVQVGAALQNARLYAESLRQRRQTEALSDVARAVSESLQLGDVMGRILGHATALLRCDGAMITLLRGDTLEVIDAVGVGQPLLRMRMPLYGSMPGRAVRTGMRIISADVASDPDVHRPALDAVDIRSAVIVPLSSVQGPVGTLSVMNRDQAFTDDDADVLQRLADQVAVAVVNARLFEEVAAATREWAVAFDAIGSGMVLLDGEGRIQRSNARARELMDVEDEQALLGHDFHETLFGERASNDQCVEQRALRERVVARGTHRHALKGRIFDQTAAPHPLGGAVVTFDDVTEHRALAERYRLVVETTNDAIVITDLERRIAFANPAAVALFGRGDVIGAAGGNVLPPDMVDKVRHHEDLAIAGIPQRYEGALINGAGERRIVAVSTSPLRELGVVTGIVASLRDVTAERSHAAALARSEARYERLVESASDAIFTVDEHGRFTAVNRALEVGVGRMRDVLIGHPLEELVDPVDHVAASVLLHETFAGARSRGAIRYRAPDGSLRNGSVITSPIMEDGRVAGALGIMRDVTDERRLAEQLLQQEKLAAVGQLVSGVAHELNNPLAGVMAFSQLLLASPAAKDEEARRAVETIHREANRAAKIVSHLLTFARQQPPERREADLNAIVLDTLELRRYSLRGNEIDVELQLDDTLPATWADPFQLQQVVLNLIGNAEHALAGWSGPKRIIVRTSHTANELSLSVGDTGPGVPDDQRDRIFNPFYTTKPVGQGTGLGLSISDGIVREHGGRIRVESVAGAGARFIVDIPLVAPPRRTGDEDPVSIDAPERAGRRILVVDDEPSMRAALGTFLGSLGYDVEEADNGEQARARLASSEYDVVLLDLRMPDLGGDVLYRELCDRDPRHARRVVFLTGDTQSEPAQRFLRDAGRPSVSKPFQLDDLASVLASMTP